MWVERRNFDFFNVTSWAKEARCLRQFLGMDKEWVDVETPELADLSSEGSFNKFKILDGKKVLFVGDSLTRQRFDSAWISPSHFRMENISAKHYNMLKAHCPPLDLNWTLVGKFSMEDRNAADFRVDFCRKHYFGIGLNRLLEMADKMFDAIVLNIGIWYNIEQQHDANYAAQRRNYTQEANYWEPLFNNHYIDDLKQFDAFLKSRPVLTKKLLWVQSTPQHFHSGTYVRNSGMTVCAAFDRQALLLSNWRNALSDNIMRQNGVNIIPIFNPLASLYFSHPEPNDNEARDCTHFCNPGSAIYISVICLD